MKEVNRYDRLLDSIEQERKSEEKYFLELTRSKTDKEKIDSGVLLQKLKVKKRYYTTSEKVEVQFVMDGDQKSHKFRVGSGCHLYINNDEDNKYRGTVSFVKRKVIGVIFYNEEIINAYINDHQYCKIELIYDERPYIVMKNAILSVKNSKDEAIIKLREGIASNDAFKASIYDDVKFNLPIRLNIGQQNAIRNIIHASHIGIIHGPPGTGKTTTLVGLVETLLQEEKQILTCAPSNNAVDLIARKLDEIGINVLRVGNVTRIGDSIAHLSMDEKTIMHPDYSHVKKIKIQAEQAYRKANTYKRKFGKSQRDAKNEAYQESRELKKWAKQLEQKISRDIIQDAEVIVSTLVGISTNITKDLHFKTVIIDEASQTLEPECWNAMLLADRTILVGDHKQLPPTVKSSEAIKLGFETTLLDILAGRIKYSFNLDTQYRMNEKILSFSNKLFYDNKLKSHGSVAQNYLCDARNSIVVIDTSGCGFEEEIKEEGTSKLNPGEYFILREHLIQHLEKFKEHSIGIISPYAAQVDFIKESMACEDAFAQLDISINSIDGFQGQEKDIIYLSLVRSNSINELGFLKDYRRLNVALTRARLKMIIIGDFSTLSTDKTYNDLATHVEEIGTYTSAWEYMSY